MIERSNRQVNRRAFLAAGIVTAGAVITARADDRPPVREPRATSGDVRVEPNWDERLTLRVGTSKGDLVGADERVLQAAVDCVARLGGGTVHLTAGTWKLRNSVFLASNVRLIGSGADTVLVKEPSAASKLKADSDWYDQEITLVDPSAFRIGDGVCLRARNPHNKTTTVLKRTLVARSGNRFKLDRPLRENLWLMEEATAATLFPILSGEHISGIAVENLVLDGNRAKNDNLDGNYAGCIFLQDCRDVSVRRVVARSFNGDGVSWQICHDVTVEDCDSHDHAGLGLHPGSGSQRPLIRNNRLRRNDIGLFFCWGVKYGLAEKNVMEDNRVGLSIGHRDTDNLIRDNDIRSSKAVGVLFRPERGKDFAAHRNRLLNNRVTDSGADNGIAIDVQGETEAVQFVGNDLRETRGPAKRVGMRLGPKTADITLKDNRVEGFAVAVEDLRKR